MDFFPSLFRARTDWGGFNWFTYFFHPLTKIAVGSGDDLCLPIQTENTIVLKLFFISPSKFSSPVIILFALPEQLYHLSPLGDLPLHRLHMVHENVCLLEYLWEALCSLTLMYCSILLVPSSNSWTNSSPQCLSFNLSWTWIYFRNWSSTIL